jgi:hypothetical protein
MISVLLMDLSEKPVAPAGPVNVPSGFLQIYIPYRDEQCWRPSRTGSRRMDPRPTFKTAVFRRTKELVDGHIVYRRVQ